MVLFLPPAGHRGAQLCHPVGWPHRPPVCGYETGCFHGGGGALDWVVIVVFVLNTAIQGRKRRGAASERQTAVLQEDEELEKRSAHWMNGYKAGRREHRGGGKTLEDGDEQGDS